VIFLVHDCSIHIERANVHSEGIARTRSLAIGLTSVEGQKLVSVLSEQEVIF